MTMPAASDTVINTVARTFFYPSLGYNVILEKIGYTQWWNEVKITPVVEEGQPPRTFPTLLLGALPFSSQLARMKSEGVERVVSMNEKHELSSSFINLPSVADYKAFGMTRLNTSVCDFTGAPSIEEIESVISFIGASPGKVYVHCKAGRCRSAVIVVACKVKFEKKRPRDAFYEVKAQRHHIVFHSTQWRRMEEYYQYCNGDGASN